MSKKNFYVGIRNEASTSTLELYFTDFIYDSWDWNTFDTTNMVQETIDKIRAANPTTIKVIVNSLGGDVVIGLALYNYLKSYKATKEVDVIGFAGSIASILAMCGDTINMAKNSFMIIHAAWSGVVGNATDMRKAADDLDKVTNELADIYAERSGKHDAAYFKALWEKGDYWMTAKEAKEMGLVDTLSKAVEANAQVDFGSYGYKNIPSALMNSASNPDAQKNFFAELKHDFMNFFNTLKASITNAKEDKKFANIQNRDEILDLVQAAIQPFAEALDKKGDGVEVVEETETTTTTTTETEAPKENQPAATEKVTEKKEEITDQPKENESEEDLRAMILAQNKKIENLTNALANSLTKPASGKSGGDNILDKVRIEMSEE